MMSLPDPLASDISTGLEKIPIQLENPDDLEEVSNYRYVLCSIPGPETLDEESQELLAGCDCLNAINCGISCSCITRFGPCYTDSGQLTLEDGPRSHHKPVYECNRHCKCSKDCKNRRVQHGVGVNLIVFRTNTKGFGLKTHESIPRNTFVCEYAGEYLTQELAKNRAQTLSKNKCPHYYILALREHLASGKTISTYVDPMFVGNVGRFINHSCNPNLYMVPVRIHNNSPRLALFALRDIQPGEELTFHYGGAEQANNCLHKQLKLCYCGSSNCSGYLPFDEDLFGL